MSQLTVCTSYYLLTINSIYKNTQFEPKTRQTYTWKSGKTQNSATHSTLLAAIPGQLKFIRRPFIYHHSAHSPSCSAPLKVGYFDYMNMPRRWCLIVPSSFHVECLTTCTTVALCPTVGPILDPQDDDLALNWPCRPLSLSVCPSTSEGTTVHFVLIQSRDSSNPTYTVL